MEIKFALWSKLNFPSRQPQQIWRHMKMCVRFLGCPMNC